MAWTFARFTNGLISDPDWHGVRTSAVGAPTATEFFLVGLGPGGARLADGGIQVRIGWLDANDQPLAGQGTCTIATVGVDALPLPTNGDQRQEIMSLGMEVEDLGAWRAEPLPVGGPGRYTIQVTAMVPPVGGVRLAVWYMGSYQAG